MRNSVILDLSQNWHICLPDTSSPVAQLAAQELASSLAKICEKPFPIHNQPSESLTILLAHADSTSDGFRWQVSPQRVDLRGDNERGLLFAVYAFLETLGVRWIAPGEAGEFLPHDTRFSLSSHRQENPALPGRCLILGHYAFMQDAPAWIEWAARNRLNTIFLHTIEDPLAFGAAPESQYQRMKAEIIEAAHQRAMQIEHGGHGLTHFLPRKLFKTMPEAFRMKDGKRTPDHNFCPSSQTGMQIIQKNAEAYFRAHPEVEIFHVWADDIPGGGWCACPNCQQYTPSEQLLLAANAVASVLADINPQAQFSFISYHDTEKVPHKVTPLPNLCLLWAPRMRCYAHDTASLACAVNTPHYHTTLATQIAYFQEQGTAPPRVFEYYLDAILFKGILPPLPTVMQDDIRFYLGAGVHAVQALMTGHYPWINPQINAWLFARFAWDPEQDTDALLADFCGTVFATDDPALPAYYRTLERAFRLALDLHPDQIKLEFDFNQLWHNPPADMGDPIFAPPEVLRAKVKANAAIEELLVQARQNLHNAKGSANPSAWQAEADVFSLYEAWLRFDLARLRLYDALAHPPIKALARQWLRSAEEAYQDAFSWAKRYLPDKRFRANFIFSMRIFWGLRLGYIRAAHFTPKGFGGLRKAGVLAKFLLMYLRLRNMYDR